VDDSEVGANNGVAPLDANGRVPNANLPGSITGGLNYLGTWDASTNTPTLSNGSGASGDYYKVDTAGSTSLDGVSSWAVGDWVISDSSAWDKIDQSETVSSVAGKTGAVTLTKADVGLSGVEDDATADQTGSEIETLLDNQLGNTDWKTGGSGGGDVSSVAGKTGAVTLVKADVGLGNVDNTSDASKPVSTLQQAEIDTKAEAVHTHDYIPTSDEGSANGVATLDANSKLTASQIPDSIGGGLSYLGTWDANANSPSLSDGSSSTAGEYYKIGTAGSTSIDGISSWGVGDWIISNGTTWEKIDQTETVSSVNGQTGAVTLTKTDLSLGNVSDDAQLTVANNLSDLANAVTAKGNLGLGNVDNTSDANKPVSTAQQTALDLKQNELAEGPFVDGDKTKLDGIESNAKDDQTGSEIEALLDAELGSTDWKTAGGGGGITQAQADTTAIKYAIALG